MVWLGLKRVNGLVVIRLDVMCSVSKRILANAVLCLVVAVRWAGQGVCPARSPDSCSGKTSSRVLAPQTGQTRLAPPAAQSRYGRHNDYVTYDRPGLQQKKLSQFTQCFERVEALLSPLIK